jgi:ectoine hydroxylase-related dioxygenase (phytanoyl-CoA dioxygenase family)
MGDSTILERMWGMDDTLELVKRFQADGAVCVRGAFDGHWLELARRGIDRNIATPSPFFRSLAEEGKAFYSDMWSRRYIPEFEEFCMQSPAATLAARLLGTDRVRLAQDTWFLKQPGTSARTPWHHDAVISGPFCSIWVALDHTPREATLEFVRGSHVWGKVMMPQTYFDAAKGGDGRSAADKFYVEFHGDDKTRKDDEFAAIPDIDADRSAYDIIGWDMAPGDCVIFDARTIHGAPGNQSDKVMRRFVTRWITDESVVASHGQSVINALAKAGLDMDLKVGAPIKGAMFPEIAINIQ